MTWQISLYYLIPVFVIVVLTVPIFVEVRVSYNPICNSGVIALFVFKKNIMYYFVSVKNCGVELSNDKVTKFQKLKFSDPHFEVMKNFTKQLKDKIRLKRFHVFYNIGTGDSFSVAMLCGALNQILLQFFLAIKRNKPTASVGLFDSVCYNRTCFEVALKMQMSVSLFEIAYSYLYSVILTNKQKAH